MAASQYDYDAAVAVAPVTDWRYYDTVYAPYYFKLRSKKLSMLRYTSERELHPLIEWFMDCVYRNLGHYETIDQINAAKYAASLPYVSSNISQTLPDDCKADTYCIVFIRCTLSSAVPCIIKRGVLIRST